MTIDTERPDKTTGSVKCVCGDKVGVGTYKVEGQKLTLISNYGTKIIHLGLQKARPTARKLLRNLCEKA